jgi:hypothetical protein
MVTLIVRAVLEKAVMALMATQVCTARRIVASRLVGTRTLMSTGTIA